VAKLEKLAAASGGNRSDHAAGRWLLGTRHDRPPTFDDPRLLAGDLRDGITEQLTVVEADAGDDREKRAHDIGGIEASPETRFEDSDIHTRPREVDEGQGCDDLKPGDTAGNAVAGHSIEGLDGGPHDSGRRGKVGRRDGSAIHADPLLERMHMRRHVAACAIPSLLEDRGEHRDGGALALRAGHMNNRHPPVRVADGREQSPHPVKAKGGLYARGAPLIIDAGVEPGVYGGGSASHFPQFSSAPVREKGA